MVSVTTIGRDEDTFPAPRAVAKTGTSCKHLQERREIHFGAKLHRMFYFHAEAFQKV